MTFPPNRQVPRALRRAARLGVLLGGALLGGALLDAALPARLRAQAVAEVQVTPETVTLGVNGKQLVFAAAYDRQGNLIPAAKFTFWSSDTSIVLVRNDGTVLGMRPGLAKVEARAGGRRASLAVLVTAGAEVAGDRLPPGAALALDPAGFVLLPGETGRFAIRASRQDKSPLAVGRVIWKALTPEVVAVDSTGVVTAIAVGRSIVQATTAGGLMATGPVEVVEADFALAPSRLVLAPGAEDTVHAHVPSQGDRRLDGGIRWSTLDSAVATVGAAGVVRAVGAGRTEVIAAGFGQDRRAAIIVHKVPEAFVVSPRQSERIQVAPNGTREFLAVAEAVDSTPIPEVPVTWTVRDSAVAAFDPASRTLTAKAVGTTTLTASIPGFEPAAWTVEVVPGFVGLRRDRLGLLPGEEAELDAALHDDAGRPVGRRPVLEWISDRPDIAIVTPDGTVRAVAPGRATIVASAPWGHRDTATVLVTGDLLVTSSRGGAPGIYALRRTVPDSFLPVVTDAAANIDGIYSPDRTRLAFSSDRAGSFDLYVADADGRNPRRVTADPGDETEPVWNPDGTELLYTAVERGPSAMPYVYTVGAEGGTPRRAAFGTGSVSSPAVSADGGTVAFVGVRNEDPDLYAAAPDGRPRQITDDGERELFPHFLPAGDLVYAVERGRGKSARVVRRTPDSDDAVKLFDADGPLAALGVSRDGTTIAYAIGKSSNDPAKFRLYLRPLGSDGKPVPVPLRPGEQISSIHF